MTKRVSFKTPTLGLALLAVCGLHLSAQVSSPKMAFNRPVDFAVSPPLRDLANLPMPSYFGFHEAEPIRRTGYHPEPTFVEDLVEQSVPGPTSNIAVGVSVSGLDKAQAGG